MNAKQREQYDRFSSNLTRGLLLADQRLAEALPNLANALRTAPLDPKLREAVILRVAALHANAYERMQHLDQARKVGWSNADIEGIEEGRFPEKISPVLQFTDECVQDGDVSDATFSKVKSLLNSRDIATIILLIGHYMMVARFTTVLRIELDAKPDSWSHEH